MPQRSAKNAQVSSTSEDVYIDEPRSLRVAVVGAGLTGILAGVLLPAKVPNIDLTIYEKNSNLSGTWLENIYPGVRCDIPGHVYQASFEPRTQWTEKFPRGDEIKCYWQDIARKYDVYRFTKLEHLVQKMVWDEADLVWQLTVLNVPTGETKVEVADFVLTSIGRFNDQKVPKFPGMEDYRGRLLHTAAWTPDIDVAGCTVAIIGNGSSGIQILPNIRPVVKRIDHYARSGTWIAPSFGGDNNSVDSLSYSQEELTDFRDPELYLKYRKENEDKYWRRFDTYISGTEANKEVRDACFNHMQECLQDRPDILEQLVPDFDPNCRRLTPGPGYLDALTRPNVELIKASIEKLTETGIKASDGKTREVDMIICATGFNIDMAPPIPICSGEKDLNKAWKHDGEDGYPYTYLGLASPGFPNLFFINGPHGTGLSGLVPHSGETITTYCAKVLRKVSREGIRTIVPSKAAADDFQEYADSFFAKTTISQHCSSWYNGGKPGGKIHGLWPGSAAHATIVRQEPRWEDYEYTYIPSASGKQNRFTEYLGNGVTKKELTKGTDMTPYLRLPENVDLRSIHEEWWQFP